jgi:hypothetical protein
LRKVPDGTATTVAEAVLSVLHPARVRAYPDLGQRQRVRRASTRGPRT